MHPVALDIQRIPICSPQALAQLGPVLCLYPAMETHVLSGFVWAVGIQLNVHVDPDGPCEALTFIDGQRRPCWQLYLLPDSDYWAWDDMLTQLCEHCPALSAPAAESEWCAVRRRASGAGWRACALQLHTVPARRSSCWLTAAHASLSGAGRRAAERLAGQAGARLSPISLPPDLQEVPS